MVSLFVMIRMGLDMGTGFVKCVSNCGSAMFPSLYVRRTHGNWSNHAAEAVGERAARMLHTTGTAAVRPIVRGRPDPRYHKQIELLVQEALFRIKESGGREAESGFSRIAVGLPYEASDCRDVIAKLVRKSTGAKECSIVAQAVGTLVHLGLTTGIIVSIGQGTTEIMVVDDNEVVDGESSVWASEFITRKISKFAHLDVDLVSKNKEICKKYARPLAEGLAAEITDVITQYGDSYPLVFSGGGMLIPGVRDELTSRLRGFKITIPDDPVMSNAEGLYKLVA